MEEKSAFLQELFKNKFFIGGIVVGVMAAFALILILGRRKKK